MWLLSFTIEAGTPLFRHLETGALLPAYVTGMRGNLAAFMAGGPTGEVDPALAQHLRAKFTYEGTVPDPLFRTALRAIFGAAGADVRVFVLLGNTRRIAEDGVERLAAPIARHNAIIGEEAAAFSNVDLLAPADFMSATELQALQTPHHFDRMVYYRIHQHIMKRCSAAAKE